MRHSNSIKKFGRERGQRRALMAGLARSLVLTEKIQTTEVKAKAIRPFVEKLITNGKKNTLAARRGIIGKIGIDGAKKIMDTLSPRFKDRNGGYTRITKLGDRKSDGSAMAVIEFLDK